MNIIQCHTASYHENGKVAYAEISYGRIVLESGSKIEEVHVNKKDSASFDTVIIANNGGAAELPDRITRDAVTVTEETLVVKVESNGSSENVYVYASGASGTTEKVTEGENKQNENVNSALGQLVLDNGSNPGEKAQTAEQKQAAKTEAVENAQALELVGEFWISLASDSFGGGSGTENDPYLIKNATQLARLAKLVMEENESVYATKYYKLNNDIDLSGKAWTPIGTEAHPFKGHFDGNGKVVTGLTNNGKGKNDLNLSSRAFSSGGYGSSYGLFGHVTNTIIEDIHIEKSTINSDDFAEAGFIVGACKNSITLRNCSVDNESSFIGLKKVGGIIGYIEFDNNGIDDEGNTVIISNCTFSGSIEATSTTNDRPSGILAAICADNNAFNNTITLTNCVVDGTITSTDYYGAFIAHIYNMRNTPVTFDNCSTINNYYAIGYLSNGYGQNISTTNWTNEQKAKLENTKVSFVNCIKNLNEESQEYYSEFNQAIKKTDSCTYDTNPLSLYQWLNSGNDITFINNTNG